MRTVLGSSRVLLVVTVAGWWCLQAPAGPWSRFRGPNGSGISTDKSIPVQWSEKDGFLWKTAIPGLGNSSPITWGNLVFVQSATPDGKERLLLCLDLIDGKILWSRSVSGAKTGMHPKNTFASSTPATDGLRVYALFWDGKAQLLNAYDLQGNPQWTRNLGGFVSQHGAAASPIVYDNKVFLANDQDGVATLIALNASTGQVAWQAPRRAFRACYSTPFVLELPGRPPELIVSSTAGITSYDPRTGTPHWDYEWHFSGMALRTVGSPLYHDGLLIANSGDGGGARHTIAIRPPEADGKAASLVWEKTRTFPYVPTMLIWGDHLYFVNDLGLASCCEAKTGKEVWTQRLGTAVCASPILIDGKIYSANEDGAIYVFAAELTFKLLAKNSLGEPVIATPAVAEHRLLVRGKNHLYCIGKTPDKQSATR